MIQLKLSFHDFKSSCLKRFDFRAFAAYLTSIRSDGFMKFRKSAMKKFLLWISLMLPFLLFPAEGENFTLPPGAPIFRNIDLTKPPTLIANRETICEIADTIVYRHEKPPLMRDITFHRFRIPGQGYFWASPDVILRINPENNTFSYEFEKRPLLMLLGAFCVFCAFLMSVLFFRKPAASYVRYLPFCAIIFFFYGIMLYLIGASGNIIQGQVDDFAYFQVAKDIASGNFSNQWSYTVGLPLFYLPFQLFLKAETLQEFYPPFLLFNCFIAAPFALCMAYHAVKKLSSAVPAFCSILVWFVMTLLYHHRYFWIENQELYADYVYKSFPALPETSFSYSLYELYTFYGYNCVSDTINMALLFACLAFVLSLKPSLRNLAFFSALYALACLVRVNNLVLAPLMLLVLYLRYAAQLREIRFRIIFPMTGALVFLAVFSIQFAVDWIQFGNPFTLPYILHGEATYKGFSFGMIPYGIKLLCNSNHAWFVTGSLALFFISSRTVRTLLAWWIYPLIFFFFGYPMVFNNATRFILPVFAAFAAAFVLMDFWKRCPRSVNLRIAAILLPSIFLTAPVSSPRLAHLLPWNLQKYGISAQCMQYVQCAVLIFSILIFLSFFYDLWKSRQDRIPFSARLMPMIFLAAFIVFFYWANPYLTVILMAGVFLRACRDTVVLVRNCDFSIAETGQ